jgi:hypothetical protein
MSYTSAAAGASELHLRAVPEFSQHACLYLCSQATVAATLLHWSLKGPRNRCLRRGAVAWEQWGSWDALCHLQVPAVR